MAKFINELSSYQNIPRDLVFDTTVSDRARFVYCFMACKPNDWDFFLEPMAKEIGYSVDTLRKYINELSESGWIEKGEQEREKGVFGATQYTLKATKNTDTDFFRHGKTSIQHNIDNQQKTDRVVKEKEIDKSIPKKKLSFNVREDLSYVGEAYIDTWNEWLDYKDEINKQYKTQRGAKMQYSSLLKYANYNPVLANAIVKNSIEHSWDGLFALTEKQRDFFLSSNSPYIGDNIKDPTEKKDGLVNAKGEVWCEQLQKWLK